MVRMRTTLLMSLMAIVAAGILYGQRQSVTFPDARSLAPDQVLSARELARLRPVVEPDLKELFKRVYNEDAPTGASLDEEFKRCRVVRLKLGTLGPALLVEDPGLGGPNSAMLNVYLPVRRSYRRIVAGIGFGPAIVSGPDSVPYLVFGATIGAGQEKLYRYRYQHRSGKYEVDACDLHTSKDLSCVGEKLPTFPDPWPQQQQE
jgi:hypothetical protein